MNTSVQLLYYGTLALLIGFGFFKFTFFRDNNDIFIRVNELLTKILFTAFLDYFIIFLRTILFTVGYFQPWVCYLYLVEVFLDVFIFLTLINFFCHVKSEFDECQQKSFIATFSDLIIWIIISFVIFVSSSMSNFSQEFISNLRTIYLLPYSFLVLTTAIVVPFNVKYFREMKYSFFFLSLGFFLDFLNLIGIFENQSMVDQVVYSIKFFSFSSIVFNFYKITVFPPQEITEGKENGCKE